MLDRLPQFIDPFLLAEKNATLEGKIPLSSLGRVRELLVNDEGEVAIKLLFGKEGRYAKVEGHITANLAVKCQRCLEAIEWPVNSDIKLGIVSTLDQANKLPESFEPLLISDEEKTPLNDIVEDEILLLLPDIPKHPTACAMPVVPEKKGGTTTSKPEQASKQNPFSILAELNKLETFNGSTKE